MIRIIQLLDMILRGGGGDLAQDHVDAGSYRY